jgi:hypothetical protein
MSGLPRAQMEFAQVDLGIGDLQMPIPSHVLNVPECGDVVFHHAEAINVGTIEVGDSASRLVIMLAQSACGCGCGARGRGLLLTPPPEDARAIAHSLLKLADEYEADAATAATNLMRRVAGK